VIWFSSFVFALVTVETYIHVHVSGVRLLLPDDRLSCMKPLITFYGSYLGGILISWYTTPFKARKTAQAERVRFGLAVCSTLLLNASVLALTLQGFVAPAGQDVAKNISTAVTLGAWTSFLVAPANLYYFGLKLNP
jgi:hypothetical protein